MPGDRTDRLSGTCCLTNGRSAVNIYCMDSRDALLQAAAEEFARSGLKGTRIREIVQRSGVNERMIYHHFGSKEGLFRAVVEHEFGGMGQAWHDVLARARE